MEIKKQEFVCNKFKDDLNTMCRHNIFKILCLQGDSTMIEWIGE